MREAATAMPTAAEDLKAEADALHRVLFGRPVPEDLARRYVDANLSWLGQAPPALPISVDTIFRRRLDLEAVEFALRLRERNNPLTRKMHTLCYLAEVRSENYAIFVQQKNRFLTALATLVLLSFRSLYKLVKGTYLVWRFRVV